ncbi:hypothetical protein ABZ801_41465 [Actinomadura sp. NPDC047616]|uniref:hypothetical protein n=1 Tax=Actinomadura sp. NPDC047616 TaxID=3155914 RepID=UPI0033E8377B
MPLLRLATLLALAVAVAVAAGAALWLTPGPRASLGAVYMLTSLAILATGLPAPRARADTPAYGPVSPSGRLLSVRWLAWRTDPATGALSRCERVWHVGTDAGRAATLDARRGWRP